jgi:dTDP-4-amino-4,6-dideoxygalactose transaminase
MEEWEAMKEPIMNGWLTSGPKVKEFEQAFAQRHQVRHAIAVTSATTALHLALVAIGVKPGDEVIVPAFTWISTANAVLYCGAEVKFVDIDPATFNVDVEDLRRKVSSKTRAIIPVHLFGLCADMDAIRQAAPGIPLVEDGACAAGAAYKGKTAGSLGDIGCFSFHPRKSVTTGEGGMLTTNSDEVADLLLRLRNHGASISEEQRHQGPRPYLLPEFSLLGYNYRMTDLQGAIGVTQLKKLDTFIIERNQWAAYYERELKGIEWLSTPECPPGYRHGWQSYVTMINEKLSPAPRNDIMEYLQREGISTRPGTHAVHMLDLYSKRYGLESEDFPYAKEANNGSMALPLHNRMVAEDYEYIVAKIKAL